MKKLLFFILFVIFAAFPVASQAFTVKNLQNFNLPANETIADNLYLAGTDLKIDGKINGDLIFGGSTLTINGEVQGDLIGFAENININGTVGGNLRIAGDNITINGQVIKNANIAGTKLSLNSNAKIGQDLLIATKESYIAGNIGSDLHGLTNLIKINGKIGRNVFLRFFGEEPKTSIIEIAPEASIVGSLNYTAKNTAKIINNASINGGVHHSPISDKWENRWKTFSLWNSILGIFSALVIGLVITTLFGKKINKLNLHIKHRPGISALIGMATMFTLPFIALILIFTLIGIPLALILLVIYFTIIYLSRIVIAIYIGGLILKKASPEKTPAIFSTMVFGIVTCWLFFSLPIVGWFLSMFATWWGMGAIIIAAKNELLDNSLSN